MSTRTIIISIVVLLAIAGAAAVFMNRSSAPATTTPGAVNSDEQVQGQDVSVGTGAEAVAGATVSVLYEGKLEDGTTFDSSAANGNQPLVFQLGQDGLIPGFQIGISGMKEGGVRIIAIPPKLGYGEQEIKGADGKVIIPANSKLIFQITLVKVETPTAQAPAGTSTPKAAAPAGNKAN